NIGERACIFLQKSIQTKEEKVSTNRLSIIEGLENLSEENTRATLYILESFVDLDYACSISPSRNLGGTLPTRHTFEGA
ncbi:MAG TPA: hypothetical protein VI958_13160, partial [Acidobacteriota bacterium]